MDSTSLSDPIGLLLFCTNKLSFSTLTLPLERARWWHMVCQINPAGDGSRCAKSLAVPPGSSGQG
jgi:hypothetical protein